MPPRKKQGKYDSEASRYLKETKLHERQSTILAFTDGSTVNNGKVTARGGFATFYQTENKQLQAILRPTGEPFFCYPITNNRCEMMGIIEAIRTIAKAVDFEKQYDVVILTDSEYISNIFNKWLPAWKVRGYRKADGKDIENRDFVVWIEKLMQLYAPVLKIEIRHINASHDWTEPSDKHSVDWLLWNGNNQTDNLAKRATTISMQLEGEAS